MDLDYLQPERNGVDVQSKWYDLNVWNEMTEFLTIRERQRGQWTTASEGTPIQERQVRYRIPDVAGGSNQVPNTLRRRDQLIEMDVSNRTRAMVNHWKNEWNRDLSDDTVPYPDASGMLNSEDVFVFREIFLERRGVSGTKRMFTEVLQLPWRDENGVLRVMASQRRSQLKLWNIPPESARSCRPDQLFREILQTLHFGGSAPQNGHGGMDRQMIEAKEHRERVSLSLEYNSNRRAQEMDAVALDLVGRSVLWPEPILTNDQITMRKWAFERGAEYGETQASYQDWFEVYRDIVEKSGGLAAVPRHDNSRNETGIIYST